MIQVFGTHWMRMKLETSEVRQPRERRRIARHDFLRATSRWELQLDDFNPRWAALGCTLLIEVLAFDAVGKSHEHVRPAASAAQRAVRDGYVVVRQVELRVLRLGEQHFF